MLNLSQSLSWRVNLSSYPQPGNTSELPYKSHQFFVDTACSGQKIVMLLSGTTITAKLFLMIVLKAIQMPTHVASLCMNWYIICRTSVDNIMKWIVINMQNANVRLIRYNVNILIKLSACSLRFRFI